MSSRWRQFEGKYGAQGPCDFVKLVHTIPSIHDEGGVLDDLEPQLMQADGGSLCDIYRTGLQRKGRGKKQRNLSTFANIVYARTARFRCIYMALRMNRLYRQQMYAKKVS
jgi:hypothetical protein